MPAQDTLVEPADNVKFATAGEDFLLRRYADSPSPHLEAELTERFMPLARALARRYRGGVERIEDLNQVASLALVKALRGYDPERGRSFKAYAAPTILGELRRHFRDHSWRLHVPRGLQEGSIAVEKAAATLAERNGSAPSVGQIAEHLGADEEEVLDALQARESQHAMSLDAPVQRDDAQSIAMGETIGRDDSGFDSVEAQLAIERCAQLDERELEVVELRFVGELNQYEIGERLGISQMQVSRLLRRALAKLLEAVQGDDAPAGRRTFVDDGRDPRFPHGRARRRRGQARRTRGADASAV